jgi:hypothetical protein
MAILWLRLVVGALVVLIAAPPATAEEYPSEVWSPYPSEEWQPRIADLPSPVQSRAERVPQAADVEVLPPPQSEVNVFGPPPLECESGCQSCCDPPAFVGYPSLEKWQVQSYFLPSLGRFGLIAPRTPGVDSVHSYYQNGPVAWGPTAQDHAIFAPPPCGSAPTGSGAGVLGGGSATPPQSDSLWSHAGQPIEHEFPCTDPCAQPAPYSTTDFPPDPFYDHIPYDACSELGIYGGKYLNPTQRPLIEWGMPLYLGGPVPPPSDECGIFNPSLPRLYLYGDYRAAVAYNAQNGADKGVLAHRINLEWDMWLTATERFHAFTGPLQRDNDFQRVVFDDGRGEFFSELDLFDPDTDTAFFEGDLGYMIGGWTGQYAPFDMPVTAGLIPLLFQNGFWMEDAIVGAAATIPARNSPTLDWSNYDITFFCGFDQVTSPAFDNSQSAARVFGATTFIDAKGGYIEAGYAFLDDRHTVGRSYNNVGISYTRRYLNLVSNSVRAIVNAGQDGPVDDRTANGLLLVVENSFLTPWQYNVIPYVNMWVGFDDPQSVARAGAAGGVLRNTGILFETDNLTGYPTLDATANDTYGAAIGLDLLAPQFTHQLIIEAAVLQVFGDPATRVAPGDQYGFGMRYQVPISNATLLRFDVMHGWFANTDDASGARAEFRWKF